MKRKAISAYELRSVRIGNVKVESRPIQWDGKDYDGQGNDANGKPLVPTLYMTTCPKCGQMLQFSNSDITTANNVDSVICTHCSKTTKTKPVKPEPVKAEPEPVKAEPEPVKPELAQVDLVMEANGEAKVGEFEELTKEETTKIAEMAIEALAEEEAVNNIGFNDPIKSGKMKIE
jgi:DNA-directed RNA polymerase subunit M/transcription elongation factor TFIIS